MAALKTQQIAEEELGKLDDMLSDAKDELLGNESEEEEEETKPKDQQQKPQQFNPLETVPEDDGELPEGELSDVIGSGGMQQSTMTEGFYDPVLGYVTFGEVYATYYAEYLQALRDGKVPAELQEKMDKYFSGLE